MRCTIECTISREQKTLTLTAPLPPHTYNLLRSQKWYKSNGGYVAHCTVHDAYIQCTCIQHQLVSACTKMDSMHEMHFFLHIKYGFFIVTVKVDVAQAIFNSRISRCVFARLWCCHIYSLTCSNFKVTFDWFAFVSFSSLFPSCFVDLLYFHMSSSRYSRTKMGNKFECNLFCVQLHQFQWGAHTQKRTNERTKSSNKCSTIIHIRFCCSERVCFFGSLQISIFFFFFLANLFDFRYIFILHLMLFKLF